MNNTLQTKGLYLFTQNKFRRILHTSMDENNKNELQEDFELTGEDNGIEPEIEEIEDNSTNKLKAIRDKLKVCEQEKMEHLENLQRAKAEFLNGKKRLEEEKARDTLRAENKQIEKLLPMADSFHMAMHDQEAWNAIDEHWRKGVEGIHTQLHRILKSYNVHEVDPTGDDFDPEKHEAMANIPVTEKALHGKVVQALQNGFIRTEGTTEELLRPARVTVGEFEEK